MDGAQLGAALLDFGSTYRFYGKGPDYRILSEDSRTVPDFILPALTPRSLGDPSFCAELGLSAPIFCVMRLATRAALATVSAMAFQPS